MHRYRTVIIRTIRVDEMLPPCACIGDMSIGTDINMIFLLSSLKSGKSRLLIIELGDLKALINRR